MDTSQLFSLKGRIALVTGGSRGIGRMIAEGFVSQGQGLYLGPQGRAAPDRRRAVGARPLHRAARRPLHRGGRPALAAAVATREGALHILVNNAGAAWGAPTRRVPRERLGQGAGAEPEGVFLLTQELQAAAREGGGPTQPAK